MNHENDQQMEVDEKVHDFVYLMICLDKHLSYEDIEQLQHLHYHHLYDMLMLDLYEHHKIVVVILDLTHMMLHLNDILWERKSKHKNINDLRIEQLDISNIFSKKHFVIYSVIDQSFEDNFKRFSFFL